MDLEEVSTIYRQDVYSRFKWTSETRACLSHLLSEAFASALLDERGFAAALLEALEEEGGFADRCAASSARALRSASFLYCARAALRGKGHNPCIRTCARRRDRSVKPTKQVTKLEVGMYRSSRRTRSHFNYNMANSE